MRDRNVVALQIIVDIHLPVAIDCIVAALRQLQSFELESSRLPRYLSEERRKRLRLRVEIYKNKLLPGFQSQRHHAHGAAIEQFHALHIRRADQPPVQGIGPAVISAPQHIFAAAPLRNRPCAMAAHVAERAQRSFLVAYHHDRLARQVRREKSLGVGDRPPHAIHFPAGLLQRSDKLPRASKNLLFLNLQNRRIGIEARRQRVCAFDLLVYVHV